VSESSPADLAVAFRSFPRRLSEALGSLAPDVRARAASHTDAVAHELSAAATALGVPAPGDPSAIAGALADKIDAVRPDGWDDATLAALRRHALAIGASLRSITDLAG
jgi:hypothetical protein